MSELLSAGLYRLRRSRLLWTVCGALALVSAGYVAWSWRAALRYYPILEDELKELRLSLRARYMDSNFFSVPAVTVMLSSALCSWELGAEYQDGAQRNKLIVGHKRRDVYLTALLLTVLVCLLLCLSVFLPGVLAMCLTAGGFAMGWSRAALQMAGLTAAAVAFASLFTLLGLNIQNRAASAIVAIGLTVALVLGGFTLEERLSAPEYFGSQSTPTPNPQYLPEGRLRDALTFLADFNPGGQVMRYCHAAAPDPLPLMGWDAVFFALASAAGLLIFRRKDLK